MRIVGKLVAKRGTMPASLSLCVALDPTVVVKLIDFVDLAVQEEVK